MGGEKEQYDVDKTFKKLKPIVPGAKTFSERINQMSNTAYQGKKLARAAQVIEEMIKDPDCAILLGYAGSMSTAGQWTIIRWLVENRYVDAIVSTGANISEDILEAMGYNYYQDVDKFDDQVLGRKFGINRYLDVGNKEEDYEIMTEQVIGKFLKELKPNKPYGIHYATQELLHLFGKWLLEQKTINGEKGIKSIVALAAKNNIPVFCPGISDSPYGDAGLTAVRDGQKLIIDCMKEYVDFMNMATKLEGKETGVIYVGGGVPKDFIQLFAVTSSLLYDKEKGVPGRKGQGFIDHGSYEYFPHKYAVQITTALSQDGGLSGCTIDEETISWGKERPDGKNVQCFCDATIALPIIADYLAEKNIKRTGVDFSDVVFKDI